LTVEEARAHFSLWAILAAPLMASCDLTSMMPEIKSILKNESVIAIDQDSLGEQGTRVSPPGVHEVWVRNLFDGGKAVVLFNRGRRSAIIGVSRLQLGVRNSTHLQAKDIWTGKDVIEERGGYSMRIQPHGAAMIRIDVPPNH
jgi:alpha-galactosidase